MIIRHYAEIYPSIPKTLCGVKTNAVTNNINNVNCDKCLKIYKK